MKETISKCGKSIKISYTSYGKFITGINIDLIECCNCKYFLNCGE